MRKASYCLNLCLETFITCSYSVIIVGQGVGYVPPAVPQSQWAQESLTFHLKSLAAKLIRDEKITSSAGVPSIVYDLFETSAVGQWSPDYFLSITVLCLRTRAGQSHLVLYWLIAELWHLSSSGNKDIISLGTGGAPAADSLASEVIKKFPNATAFVQIFLRSAIMSHF